MSCYYIWESEQIKLSECHDHVGVKGDDGVNKYIMEMDEYLERNLKALYGDEFVKEAHEFDTYFKNLYGVTNSVVRVGGEKTKPTTDNKHHVSKESNMFSLRDAKMDKLEELEEFINRQLEKPLKIRDHYWGIDDESIRRMEIRLSMVRGDSDTYHVDVLDYNGNQYPTPKIERLENILGLTKLERDKIYSYRDNMKDSIESKTTIDQVVGIKFSYGSNQRSDELSEMMKHLTPLAKEWSRISKG